MIKNWLIRTKNNHILGPISKNKVIELLDSGSIKGDDEICCGNGHWIYVREKELLDRYVYGDEEQSFNPVQEAEPCEISSFPPDYDLLVGNPNEDNAENQVNQTLVQENPLLKEKPNFVEVKAPKNLEEKKKNSVTRKGHTKRIIKVHKSKALFSKHFLYFLLFVLGFIIAFSIWNKSLVIESLSSVKVPSLINTANAQVIEKKKPGITNQF